MTLELQMWRFVVAGVGLAVLAVALVAGAIDLFLAVLIAAVLLSACFSRGRGGGGDSGGWWGGGDGGGWGDGDGGGCGGGGE